MHPVIHTTRGTTPAQNGSLRFTYRYETVSSLQQAVKPGGREELISVLLVPVSGRPVIQAEEHGSFPRYRQLPGKSRECPWTDAGIPAA